MANEPNRPTQPPIPTTRKVVALEGGPKRHQWYFEDDFFELQAAHRRAHSEYTADVADVCLDYHSTGRMVTKAIGRATKTQPGRIATAEVWEYRPGSRRYG